MVEELGSKYATIRYMVKPKWNTNYTQINYPTRQGWEETESLKEREDRILQQNKTHFAQANNTLIAQQGEIFKVPHNIQPQDIQKAEIPDTKHELKQFFRQDKETKEITTEITTEELIHGIRAWKEKKYFTLRLPPGALPCTNTTKNAWGKIRSTPNSRDPHQHHQPCN